MLEGFGSFKFMNNIQYNKYIALYDNVIDIGVNGKYYMFGLIWENDEVKQNSWDFAILAKPYSEYEHTIILKAEPYYTFMKEGRFYAGGSIMCPFDYKIDFNAGIKEWHDDQVGQDDLIDKDGCMFFIKEKEDTCPQNVKRTNPPVYFSQATFGLGETI